MPILPENYETLSAMITPALFMTATGSLIISTSNRTSRVVDRIRQLNREADDLGRGVKDVDFVADRLEHVSAQLDRMVRRSDLVRLALTLLYSAMAMFVATSLAVALVTLAGGSALLFIPTTTAIMGVCLMFAACIQLLRETTIALRNNRLEILFYDKLRALRERQATPPKES